MGRVCMGRLGNGPSLLWAEMSSYLRSAFVEQRHAYILLQVKQIQNNSSILNRKWLTFSATDLVSHLQFKHDCIITVLDKRSQMLRFYCNFWLCR